MYKLCFIFCYASYCELGLDIYEVHFRIRTVESWNVQRYMPYLTHWSVCGTACLVTIRAARRWCIVVFVIGIFGFRIVLQHDGRNTLTRSTTRSRSRKLFGTMKISQPTPQSTVFRTRQDSVSETPELTPTRSTTLL
uniref:Uncharacterized protein n=2 Tax=Cacopsylla melanoneura TaxID=428564 RepID=A0A8D9EVT0_9HEMI